jgi:hypothetical protein
VILGPPGRAPDRCPAKRRAIPWQTKCRCRHATRRRSGSVAASLRLLESRKRKPIGSYSRNNSGVSQGPTRHDRVGPFGNSAGCLQAPTAPDPPICPFGASSVAGRGACPGDHAQRRTFRAAASSPAKRPRCCAAQGSCRRSMVSAQSIVACAGNAAAAAPLGNALSHRHFQPWLHQWQQDGARLAMVPGATRLNADGYRQAPGLAAAAQRRTAGSDR